MFEFTNLHATSIIVLASLIAVALSQELRRNALRANLSPVEPAGRPQGLRAVRVVDSCNFGQSENQQPHRGIAKA